MFIRKDIPFKKGDKISQTDFDLILNENDKSYFNSELEFNDDSTRTIALKKTTLKVSAQEQERGSVSYNWKYSSTKPSKDNPIEVSLPTDSKSKD